MQYKKWYTKYRVLYYQTLMILGKRSSWELFNIPDKNLKDHSNLSV